MKTYKVTLHMNNGDYLYLDDFKAESPIALINELIMAKNFEPAIYKFNHVSSGDSEICYCVAAISSIHYKEI